MKQRRLDIRQQMRQYKSKIGCHLCGETHFACLDFHHKNPGEKEYKVSTLVHDGHSWDSIMQEVEKCVLLCANCHRKIHVKEV